MAREAFQDPCAPYEDGDQLTIQIHAPLPERVPIGHFDSRGSEVIKEVVSRSEYLERIQQQSRQHGQRLWLRFYAYYGEDQFDASLLDQLSDIQSLAIDTYCPVAVPDAVGRLPKLIRLRFSPRGKTRPDILTAFGVERLESFTLAETATPAIDLSPLGEARSMRTLRLLARGKNTEAIGNCTSLTELAIRPSDQFPLEFINRLTGLEVLKFVLGRVASIEAIAGLPALRDLSFREVHLLEKLGDLQRFPRLRRLQLSDQKWVQRLHVGPGNPSLEHLHLYSVPALERIEGLGDLPVLKSLWAYDSRLHAPWSELPPTLTHFQLVARLVKGRKEHDAEVRARGLIPERHPDAEFFYK